MVVCTMYKKIDKTEAKREGKEWTNSLLIYLWRAEKKYCDNTQQVKPSQVSKMWSERWRFSPVPFLRFALLPLCVDTTEWISEFWTAQQLYKPSRDLITLSVWFEIDNSNDNISLLYAWADTQLISVLHPLFGDALPPLVFPKLKHPFFSFLKATTWLNLDSSIKCGNPLVSSIQGLFYFFFPSFSFSFIFNIFAFELKLQSKSGIEMK